MEKEEPETGTVKALGWIKATDVGTAHIPALIRKSVGMKKIPYIMDAHAILLFDPSKSLEQLLESLEIMKRDLIQRWKGPIKSVDEDIEGEKDSMEVSA